MGAGMVEAQIGTPVLEIFSDVTAATVTGTTGDDAIGIEIGTGAGAVGGKRQLSTDCTD
jgi:hypothetical protein